MLGDYVLQNDFLAKTKGSNPWHMVAHCVLYAAPFAVLFEIDWRIWLLLLSHVIIDELKVHGKIDYKSDQVLHLFFALLYF
jgi:hypothetical protein